MVEFVSPRELAVLCVGIVGAVFCCFSFLAQLPIKRFFMMYGGLTTFLCALIANRWLDDYHIVDGESGVVWLHRSAFGRSKRIAVATFADCREVTLSSTSAWSSSDSWHWTLNLVLENNRTIRLSNVALKASSSLDAPVWLVETGNRVAALISKPLRIIGNCDDSSVDQLT